MSTDQSISTNYQTLNDQNDDDHKKQTQADFKYRTLLNYSNELREENKRLEKYSNELIKKLQTVRMQAREIEKEIQTVKKQVTDGNKISVICVIAGIGLMIFPYMKKLVLNLLV